jgi:hypothetical protein
MKTKLYFLTIFAALLLVTGCKQPINNDNGGEEFRIVAPEEPSVIPGDHIITVIVTEVATATGYEVWYGTDPSPANAVRWPGEVTIDGRKISAVITSLDYDVKYFVWLKAIFSTGTSGFSIAGSGIPLPMPGMPGGASVSGGDTNLTVTWGPASNATSYDIFYSTSGGSEPPENAGKNTTSALKTVINGLTNGSGYTVWVRAANSAGVSGFTTANGSPNMVSASSPAIITTVTGGNKKLTLTWPWTAGVYGYAIYGNTADNFGTAVKKMDTVLPTGDTITAVVTGLTNGTIHYVWVRGKTSTGTYDSSYSVRNSGTPNPKAAIDYSNPSLVIGTAAARFINEEAANSDRLSRKKETALGDLVTEGLAWWARDNAHTIDFAFLNGGIITGALPVGPITVGAIKKILPYDEDTVTILTLTGSQVSALFNYVSKVRHDGGGGSGTGAWGMVSKEVRYVINYNLTADGSGVLQNLTFNGADIDPAATYRIATSDYLYTGGDGYGAYLGGTNVIRTGIPITKAVCEYIYDQDAPLVPSTDGRVTLIGGVVK